MNTRLDETATFGGCAINSQIVLVLCYNVSRVTEHFLADVTVAFDVCTDDEKVSFCIVKDLRATESLV